MPDHSKSNPIFIEDVENRLPTPTEKEASLEQDWTVEGGNLFKLVVQQLLESDFVGTDFDLRKHTPFDGHAREHTKVRSTWTRRAVDRVTKALETKGWSVVRDKGCTPRGDEWDLLKIRGKA